MDQSATDRAVHCDTQRTYQQLCTPDCPYITTADAACTIYFCSNHCNVHYCGINDCKIREYDVGGCSCPLTGTRLDATGYLADNSLSTMYSHRKKRADGAAGKGDSDSDGDTPSKTKDTVRMNRWSKADKMMLRMKPVTSVPLSESTRRLGIAAVRCLQKRRRARPHEEDNDEEEEDDNDDDGEFDSDAHHHRREQHQQPKAATSASITAAAKRKADSIDQKKRPVTEEMRQKQRQIFRSATPVPPSPTPSPVPFASQPAKVIPRRATNGVASSSSSPSSSSSSSKSARMSSSAFHHNISVARSLLQTCVSYRNTVNNKKNDDEKLPVETVTDADFTWFGNTCNNLWKALIATPQYKSDRNSFSYNYLCMFVLFDVTRDGLHYRAMDTEDGGNGETRACHVAPNLALRRKLPGISHIQHIGQFTNSQFTFHQRQILGAFAAEHPGERERRKRACIEKGSSKTDEDESLSERGDVPDLSTIINQTSVAITDYAAPPLPSSTRSTLSISDFLI